MEGECHYVQELRIRKGEGGEAGEGAGRGPAMQGGEVASGEESDTVFVCGARSAMDKSCAAGRVVGGKGRGAM